MKNRNKELLLLVIINAKTHIYTVRNGFMWICLNVKVTQLRPTLCNPMDYTVRGIIQARILEWVTFPFSRGSSQPRDRTQVSCIAGGFFTIWATGKPGVGSLSLLQQIFPTKELNPSLLHCRWILYQCLDIKVVFLET